MTEQELKKRRELQEFAMDIDFASVNLSTEDRYEIAKALMILGYQKIPYTAQGIFDDLRQNISFDGRTVGVWKKNILQLAEKYGVDMYGDRT